MALNVADITIIIAILISTGIGIYRGFIRELLTIVTWIVAAFLAYMYGKTVGEYFFFTDEAYTKEIIGMLVVFLVVTFIGYILKLIICKLAKISGVKPIDRVTGALFGALRGCLIIVLLLYFSSKNITNQDWYKKSELLPRFSKVAKMLPKSLDTDVKQGVEDFMHKEQSPAPVSAAKPAPVAPEASALPRAVNKQQNLPAANTSAPKNNKNGTQSKTANPKKDAAPASTDSINNN